MRRRRRWRRHGGWFFDFYFISLFSVVWFRMERQQRKISTNTLFSMALNSFAARMTKCTHRMSNSNKFFQVDDTFSCILSELSIYDWGGMFARCRSDSGAQYHTHTHSHSKLNLKLIHDDSSDPFYEVVRLWRARIYQYIYYISDCHKMYAPFIYMLILHAYTCVCVSFQRKKSERDLKNIDEYAPPSNRPSDRLIDRCYNVDLKTVIHDNKQHKCENKNV